MAKKRTITLGVAVRCPANMTPQRAARLVKRLLDAGMEDARVSAIRAADYADPDRADVLSLRVGRPVPILNEGDEIP
jgi:hypothetical protein